MEERINREIMDYKESIGGLELRQFLWTAVAVALSVIVYFSFSHLGTNVVSWICVTVAIPPVLLGFATWHKMNAEQILAVLYRYMITPSQLCWKCDNQFVSLLKQERQKTKKGQKTCSKP